MGGIASRIRPSLNDGFEQKNAAASCLSAAVFYGAFFIKGRKKEKGHAFSEVPCARRLDLYNVRERLLCAAQYRTVPHRAVFGLKCRNHAVLHFKKYSFREPFY